jgi:hypothetical protein
MSRPESAVGDWRRSSRCESQHCVEVAEVAGGIAVRDSTDPCRSLRITAPAWRRFLAALHAGQLGRMR